MRTRTLTYAFALLALLGAAPLLSACNTTAGAGEDIQATGRAIEGTARRAQ